MPMRPKEDFSRFYPLTTKRCHVASADLHVRLTGLRPNTYIFFFASKPRLPHARVYRANAYGRLENSGVTKINAEGSALIRLHSPSVYINPEDNSIYPNHFHYVYWNKLKKTWSSHVYTHDIRTN